MTKGTHGLLELLGLLYLLIGRTYIMDS